MSDLAGHARSDVHGALHLFVTSALLGWRHSDTLTGDILALLHSGGGSVGPHRLPPLSSTDLLRAARSRPLEVEVYSR